MHCSLLRSASLPLPHPCLLSSSIVVIHPSDSDSDSDSVFFVLFFLVGGCWRLVSAHLRPKTKDVDLNGKRNHGQLRLLSMFTQEVLNARTDPP